MSDVKFACKVKNNRFNFYCMYYIIVGIVSVCYATIVSL
jgi:hypothetical protein